MMTVRKRNTKQKDTILRSLQNRTDHPSADELYEEVRKELPRISLGTVYRNLMNLSEAGEIRVLDTGSGHRRFDPDTSDHAHFRCLRCGRVEDVPGDVSVPRLDRGEPWVREREIRRGYLIYVGLCPVCRQEGEDGADA